MTELHSSLIEHKEQSCNLLKGPDSRRAQRDASMCAQFSSECDHTVCGQGANRELDHRWTSSTQKSHQWIPNKQMLRYVAETSAALITEPLGSRVVKWADQPKIHHEALPQGLVLAQRKHGTSHIIQRAVIRCTVENPVNLHPSPH